MGWEVVMGEGGDAEPDIYEGDADAWRAEVTTPLGVPRRPRGKPSVGLLTFSIPPEAEAVDDGDGDGLSVDW